VFTADELIGLLREEIIQRGQEGCNVKGYKGRLRQAGKNLSKLETLYDRLARLKPPREMIAAEPSDLAAIRKCRPRGPRRIKSPVSAGRLRKRIRGAMLARCAGCQLGKPVEGFSRERIWKGLKAAREFPLRNYFSQGAIKKADGPLPGMKLSYCTRASFNCMERDDDIDYTILGIHYLRKYGRKFTTANVAFEWLDRLPYQMVYTAERAAYKNLVGSVPLGQVPYYHNPFREWIGAQIRADGFGYCAAGLPQLAAEFAHRDAALSHVKNGIYGEMLFAAMIAAACVCDDLDEVIEIGLSEIPRDCRLASALRDVCAWSDQNRDWKDTLAAIEAAFGHYNWVHTINNASLVIMGLKHGKMDLTRTIGIAVMGGMDTDCNGATAGSVVGAMLGEDQLPAKWIRPLRNHLRSFVVGYDNMAITDVADLAFNINRTLRK
jgi:ADP-ribosylglycohydrolase